MTGAIYYPKANRTKQWFGPGNYIMPTISKLLWHSTETPGGWPGYQGGAAAPTLTYDPWKHEWRQHFQLNGSARALVDPSGTVVRENRDNLVQVEISAYCDPNLANRYGHYIGDLDDQAINDLGEFAAFLHDQWDLPLRNAPLWLPYPASAGNSRARMSGPTYDAYTGILGHQHASGNVHGDPGALNVTAILAAALRATGSGSLPSTGTSGTGGGGAGGGLPPQKGILGMSDTVKLERSKDQSIPSRKWTTLRLTDKDTITLLSGPATFDAMVTVELEGLPVGDSVQLRFYTVHYQRDGGKTETSYQWLPVEVPGTTGATKGQIKLVDTISTGKAAGWAKRLRCQIYTNRPGVKVTRVQTRALKD